MRSYCPTTADERLDMLKTIGVSSIDELFNDIPQELKLNRGLNLPQGKSELEVRRLFECIVNRNNNGLKIFRGAGAYNHYIPAAVPQLAARSEFFTAYTPYQAEMSQGMLQCIFEYQSLICRITGLAASNASVYDGATAAAEVMGMMCAAKRKSKLLLSAGLHPEIIETVKTYARNVNTEIVVIPLDKNGITDMDEVRRHSEGSAGLIAASPNFYGCIENTHVMAETVHESGCLLAMYVNPISLGLLKRPGDCGVDIALGDIQPLGLPLSFGGPYGGFIACTEKLTRNLPGRIAGQTTDADGNRVFVLTLQAREQHIRRDKAASNICSNQMLCAIMSSIYMACMGPHGMREVAESCLQKAHYLADGMARIPGMRLRYETPFFNEFVVDCDFCSERVNDILKSRGFMGGLPLSRLENGDTGMLWCVTECASREDIDELLLVLEAATKEVRV